MVKSSLGNSGTLHEGIVLRDYSTIVLKQNLGRNYYLELDLLDSGIAMLLAGLLNVMSCLAIFISRIFRAMSDNRFLAASV